MNTRNGDDVIIRCNTVDHSPPPGSPLPWATTCHEQPPTFPHPYAAAISCCRFVVHTRTGLHLNCDHQLLSACLSSITLTTAIAALLLMPIGFSF